MKNSYASLGEGRPAWFFAPFFTVERIFSALFLLLGYAFWECWWQAGRLGGWMLPLAVFSLLYAGAVLGYMYAQGRRPAGESWFWLAVLEAVVWSFTMPWAFSGQGLAQGFGSIFAAVALGAWWAFTACGGLTLGRTSHWLAVDGLCALLLTPFANFGRLGAGLFSGAGAALARRKGGRKGFWALFAGLAAGLCLAAMALPLLTAADQNFRGVFDIFHGPVWQNLGGRLLQWGFKSLLAIPTALYLFGLAHGAAHRRPACFFEREGLREFTLSLHAAPTRTIAAALAVPCGLYALFCAFQARYLFGAFWGALPQGFTYAEYARQGFFELLQVSFFNGCVLILAWVAARRTGRLGVVKALCAALCCLTLVLLATAGAKLGLYVAAYGWTLQRVNAAAGLLWLAGVFCLCLWRLRRPFPLTALCVWYGAVLYCGLLWVHV